MLCCKAVYGGWLWRPVLILEFARLVQQSLGTCALFLSYVVVKIEQPLYKRSIIIIIMLELLLLLLFLYGRILLLYCYYIILP
jgi:hypothetical protein